MDSGGLDIRVYDVGLHIRVDSGGLDIRVYDVGLHIRVDSGGLDIRVYRCWTTHSSGQWWSRY